ncbi:uncharacterized protein LOC141829913 [Curcuma longa]|uniref:uncharacterized protein LOC141829913 n=1 Tax=Curcuma longa TaxID=136217 RepID=UPI003D9F876C
MAAVSLCSSVSSPWLLRKLPVAPANRMSPFALTLTRCRSSSRPFLSSYATPNTVESVPIDVSADVKTEKIVVLGGTGFVGSAICKAAVSKGIEVVSVSRSGRPSYTDSWIDQVRWIAGMVLHILACLKSLILPQHHCQKIFR